MSVLLVESKNLYKGVKFLEVVFTKFLYTFIDMIPNWERVELLLFGGFFDRT